MSSESFVFVLMPFEDKLTQIYERFIKVPLETKGYLVKRADNLYKSTPILEDIVWSIEEAEFLIAELTGKNPNVYYELGIAHEKKKTVFLISQNIEDVTFDLKHRRTIIYEDSPRGYEELADGIIKFTDNYINEIKDEDLITEPTEDTLDKNTIGLRKIIEEIKEYGKSRISDIVTSIDFKVLLRITHMIYKELTLIEDWKELEQNSILFDFLHYSINLREEQREKQILLTILMNKIKQKKIYGFERLYDKFIQYLEDKSLKLFITENFLDDLILIYAESSSYQDANITSNILYNLRTELKPRHLLNIADAYINNSQIKDSFKGSGHVKRILRPNFNALPTKTKKELKKLGF
ncbi:MAG TPA: hypothetical protein ENI29_15305 [bacterium]|nr:hypothetical protein [bacterium]